MSNSDESHSRRSNCNITRLSPDWVAKAYGSSGGSVRDLGVKPIEGSTHNEQDVPGVKGHHIPPGVLAAPLLWHIDSGALQHLEQGLLHALATDIPCDADVVVLDHDLVNLHMSQTDCSAEYIWRCRLTHTSALHIPSRLASAPSHTRPMF